MTDIGDEEPGLGAFPDWRPSETSRTLLETASEQWRRALVDVSRSNRRLFYRPLKVGTLDLADAEPQSLKRLLSGEAVRVSALFPDDGSSDAPARQAQARRACDAIYKRSVETEEETGSNPARLAVGAATFSPLDSGVASGRFGGRVEETPLAPLILLPVRFELAPGTRSVASLVLDGEAELNSALRYVLRTQFRADLDEDTLLAEADPDGPGGVVVDPSLVAAAAARALRGEVDGWDVRPHTAIDYFGSDRELMIQDLSDIEVLAAHPLVAAMAGDASAQSYVAGEPLPPADVDDDLAKPDRVLPQDEFLVLDADASQQRVIDLVLSGRNLVVQGPPGTGKSQTISNLIAECAARGKTVLFVAQKRAAISAVLQRLQARDLGRLVLEVFDAKTRRTHVLAQLRDSVDSMGSAPRADVVSLHADLQNSRQALIDHRESLHRARLELGGHTVVELYSALMRLDAASQTQERLPVATVSKWGLDGIAHLAAVLENLVSLGALEPEWSETAGWNPAAVTSDQIAGAGQDAVMSAQAVLADAQLRAARAASDVGLPDPQSVRQSGELAQLLTRAQRLGERVDSSLVDPGVVDDGDLARLTFAVADRSVRKASAPSPAVGWFERRRLKKRALSLTGAQSGPEAYGRLLESASLRRAWNGRVRSSDDSVSSARAYEALLAQLDELSPLLHKSDLPSLPWDLLSAELRRLAADSRRARMPRAHHLASELRSEGADPLVSAVAIRIRAGHDISPHEAGQRLSWAALSSLLESLVAVDPALSSAAQPRELAKSTMTFRAADAYAISTNASRVRRAAAEVTRSRLIASGDQQRLLVAELKKKRKLRSLRELVEQAPDAMLAAAPCWAMSPLLVSRYLPALPLFDLVIYDEASQVTVPDAVPSLLRGKQVVVAGDDMQLPPTLVFTKLLDVDGDSVVDAPPATADVASEPLVGGDPETGDLDAAEQSDASATPVTSTSATTFPVISVAVGYASILTALESILPSRTLLWHYRSRDERLIAVSNTYVYRRRLITFPGPESAEALKHVVVPPSTGIGPHNKSPEGEVSAAVDLCIEHAMSQQAKDPAEWATLGVIAMGSEHGNRIEKALFERILRSGDAYLKSYFDADNDEPVFIKNIERVQGDERDHIVLSVGYGTSADGRMRYMWGPLLGEYGVNRLNVAISRSRSHMTLITSFTADQLDESRSANPGYRLMREFVLFAASGGTRDVDQLDTNVPMNPFEADIYGRLVDAGLKVDTQYGVAGYRLDFAVRHPTQPNRHVLAVEADGATYHSGWTARERDRLRQQHLESLGWRFERIWSSDYWRDPDAEIAAVVAAVHEAARRADSGQALADPPPSPDPRWTGHAERGSDALVRTSSRPAPAWVRMGEPIGSYTDDELVSLVLWLREDGVLRLPDDELGELMAILGFSRRGSVIVERLTAVLGRADQIHR